VAVFALAGLIAVYHGLHPARRRDRFSLPAAGLVFLFIAAAFLAPFTQSWLLPLFWFCAKTGAILFAFIWVRGTLPRFRYDQLMGFAWKYLFPVAIVNLLATGLGVALFG
jgi:NADH-quinone oxidoreductase subunit H